MRRILRIELEPSDNGGISVRHHYQPTRSSGSSAFFTRPIEEVHIFPADDHVGMLTHLANHLNLNLPKEKEDD